MDQIKSFLSDFEKLWSSQPEKTFGQMMFHVAGNFNSGMSLFGIAQANLDTWHGIVKLLLEQKEGDDHDEMS